ncbi:MAG TPA: hypothetical protein VNL14_11925 [Candidatus Acidoferrales bacterium]|nr:hypothetical protein [Candidatus Acidoferrales bacterium]
MLTKGENETSTKVGPGTPSGELRPRYRHPAAVAQEPTEENPTGFVRRVNASTVERLECRGRSALDLVNMLMSIECEIARVYFTLSRSARDNTFVKFWASLAQEEKYHEWVFRDAKRCLRVFERPPEFARSEALSRFLFNLKRKREDNLRGISSLDALRLALEIEKTEADLLYREGIGSLVPNLAEEWRPFEAHWFKISEIIHDYSRDPKLIREARKLSALAATSERGS